MMESLDMDGLRAFVAIVDSMSFSRAGEAIGRSQSAISLRLRRLEQSLGVSLLVRRQGRVTELTSDGETLLTYARQIIALNDIALREISGQAAPACMRLGLPADFLDLGFHDALAQIRPILGEFSFELETDVSDRLRGRCEIGELDMVFYKQEAPDGFGTPVTRLELAWAGPVRDPGRHLHSGQELPLVCFPEGCVYRRAMINALRAAGIPHKVAFTTPGMDSLRQAVSVGMGVTALPTAVLERDESLHPLDGLPRLGDVSLAVMVAPGNSIALRRLAEALTESLLALVKRRNMAP